VEVSGELHALATVPLGKEPWQPLNRRPGGPQSQPECSAGLDYTILALVLTGTFSES
jgi:hypothetical protein